MKYLGIIAGILALAANSLIGHFPYLADVIYYRTIFQLVRAVYDYTLGLLPVPMVYVLFCILVWIIAHLLGKVWDSMKSGHSITTKVVAVATAILNPIGWVLFAFYFLWGWNYQRTPFEQRMGLPTVTADTTYLYQEALQLAQQLAAQRRQLKADSMSFTYSDVPSDMESIFRQHQEQLISGWGEPTLGRVRIRVLQPQGILLRISTAGVYIPFVCEGHIDKGLHPLQYPFTMAHEMAHGYGYTDEGVCNFVGYLTCLSTDSPMLQYSGKLGYFRYVLSNLRTYAPASYKEVRSGLSYGIRLDLHDIATQMDKFPDIMPEVRNAVYDSYLKSHGVSQGIANYNDIVRLVAQYRATEESSQD